MLKTCTPFHKFCWKWISSQAKSKKNKKKTKSTKTKSTKKEKECQTLHRKLTTSLRKCTPPETGDDLSAPEW